MSASLTQNALKVLERRYLTKNSNGQVVETPEEMFERVASHIASADKNYGKSDNEVEATELSFYEMMFNLEFMPNSPTLMNAGRPLGQLSACFVLPIDDSIESIFESLKAAALIHKSGGGTGFDFSRLRPRNSRVCSTDGVSSGPISFMRVYNAATQEIKQGGRRRGANMGILRVDHPEIMDFITAKDDNKDITNFNISIAITDKFVDALENGSKYELIDPHNGKVTEKLYAKEVFDLIVKQAWKNGEPGIVFIDKINKDNPTPNVGVIESTNPCITADSWIMTAEGPRYVADLIAKRFSAVVDGQNWASANGGFFKTGVKKIYKLKTEEGFELSLTADHLLRRVNRIKDDKLNFGWVTAADLNPGDKVALNNHRNVKNWSGKYGEKEGYLTGLIIGNRCSSLAARVPVRDCTVSSSGGDFKDQIAVQGREEFRLSKNIAQDLGLKTGFETVTPEIEKTSSGFYKGLLRGLFDIGGSVQSSQAEGITIRLVYSDLDSLKAVQRMLLRLGIFSEIYADIKKLNKEVLFDDKGLIEDQNIECERELVISDDNILQFFGRVGFADRDKIAKLRESLENYAGIINKEQFTATIESLVESREEDVFDAKIPGINAFDANGFYVHNCGEQPLLPYESCNLGSINLSKMLKRVDGALTVDWERLRIITHRGVHFLDNVIDKNQFPLLEIEERTKLTRKIGLGVMGWADMLIKLGIGYNSEAAVELAEEVMGFILNEAMVKSQELAEERGVFPAYKDSFWDKKGVEVRNATLTTIAPTGTISIISDCSSGIEPLFALVYTRHVMDNDRLLKVNPEFEIALKEKELYSDKLIEQIAAEGSCKHSDDIPEDLKRVFVTAHDVAPEWHIKMQAAFQKFVHNATSKTINFPNSATVEDVKESYLLAYKLGCKGTTIYRNNSREEQVLNIGDTTSEIDAQRIPDNMQVVFKPRPRPKVLRGSTTNVLTGCGTLYVTINEDEEGNIFEVFMQMGKSGGCAASQLEAIGRLISTSIRAGVDPEAIIKQLKGIRCPSPSWEKGGTRIFSCADAIARVVEDRIREKEAQDSNSAEDIKKVSVPVMAKGGNVVGVCPDCGSSLVHEEGCLKCMSCGYSKC